MVRGGGEAIAAVGSLPRPEQPGGGPAAAGADRQGGPCRGAGRYIHLQR